MIYVIEMTKRNWKEIEGLLASDPALWERLADFTETPPDYLKRRLYGSYWYQTTPGRRTRKIRELKARTGDNHVLIVVGAKEAGRLETI